MATQPTVSIVIPAYNEEEVIGKCLESCIAQTDAADEIIVVNNNSRDKTASIVRRLQQKNPTKNIRLFNQLEQGLIPTRNLGFKVAKSDILGRIDADSILTPGWVASVRKAFSDTEVMAATGPVVYHDMPLPDFGLTIDSMIRQALHKSARRHTFVFGSNMAIRASAWEQIKGMTHRDEKDELHEDIDIALCLFRQKLKVVYDSTMIGGMSARRLEDKPKDFYNYVMRFERTFKVHNCKSASARIPIFIYLLIYFPIRTIRKFYDTKTNKFTLQKLRRDIEQARS